MLVDPYGIAGFAASNGWFARAAMGRAGIAERPAPTR